LPELLFLGSFAASRYKAFPEKSGGSSGARSSGIMKAPDGASASDWRAGVRREADSQKCTG
jgi:hypothetical protein